jgi:penicillin-binding protein 1A
MREGAVLHALGVAVVVAIIALFTSFQAIADEVEDLWRLKPDRLRVLVNSAQVMVTNRDGRMEAVCRCPVILRPNEIPEVMKQAIIAVEDRRFRDHNGIDFTALAGAILNGGNRGASTIPMQLLKNLAFHGLRADKDRYARKMLEWLAAMPLSSALDKEEVLAAYLNQIEFGGPELTGLYRASRHYFSKEPRDLTTYEAAMLAGMVQAPARFNPRNPTRRAAAHRRAKRVLKLMEDQGRLKVEERRSAERIGVRPGNLAKYHVKPQAFAEWVAQRWGPEFVKPGETLRFFVTLEPRYQRIMEQSLAELAGGRLLPAEYEAAAVLMKPDGQVLGMVGSVDWSRNQFNGAVKGQVQVGSTAKMPLLVAACEARRTPDSRVLDAPITADWPAHGGQGYKGETTIKEAIKSSRNAAAVRLAREIGPGKVVDVMRRIGIDPGQQTDSAVVLGPFTSNVMTMTAAYAALANGGHSVSGSGVLAIVDGQGRVRHQFFEREQTRIVSERCVAQTKSVLREVVVAGTGRGAALRARQAYGKTGTTSGNADAWFIGWSDGKVLGVWMGKRRGVETTAVAGSGAPSEFFSRTLNAVYEMEDYRRRRAAEDVTSSTAAAARKTGTSRHLRATPPAQGRKEIANTPLRPAPLPPRKPRPMRAMVDV